MTRHDLPALVDGILGLYALPVWGVHGVLHWARVLENGLRLADQTGADREVVTLFALFHDACRVNEGDDHGHGARGARLAASWRGSLIRLDDARFALLDEACRFHTHGRTRGDPTVLTCWDADRLDLGRVCIRPEPGRLGTEAARRLLPWADRRAVAWHEPVETLRRWGVKRSPARRPEDAVSEEGSDGD